MHQIRVKRTMKLRVKRKYHLRCTDLGEAAVKLKNEESFQTLRATSVALMWNSSQILRKKEAVMK